MSAIRPQVIAVEWVSPTSPWMRQGVAEALHMVCRGAAVVAVAALRRWMSEK